MEKIKLNKFCNPNCEHIMTISKIGEGDSGTMRSPEPFTFEYTGYVCCKYKKELEQNMEWCGFSFKPNKNQPPLRTKQCDYYKKIFSIGSKNDGTE